MDMYTVKGYAKILLVLIGTGLLTDCTLEPIQPDKPVEVVKNAPEWVNEGSKMVKIDKDTRVFRGVASISLEGDMAMQKSFADDKSIAETGHVLADFLDSVSSAYLTAVREEDDLPVDDGKNRGVEKRAARNVKENLTTQIDNSIQRQFRQDVSPQFKEDVYRRIKDSSSRQIKDSIAYQVEFSAEMQDEIDRQIKAAVSRQLLNTTGVNLSGAHVIENWRDPQTNMMWSRSELRLSYVKNILAGSKELNMDLKEYFDKNAEQLFDGMLKKDDDGFSFFK